MSFVKRNRPLCIAGILLLAVGAVAAATFLLGGLAGGAAEATAVTYYKAETGYLSPGDVAVLGSNAYFADATGNKVIRVNLTNNTVTKTYACDGAVNGIYADDGKVYALVGGLAGKVVCLNSELALQWTADVGHTPVAAVSKNGTLYVVNRFSGDLSAVNVDTHKVTATVKIGREPMAVKELNGKLYIACHLPEGASNAGTTSSAVAVVDTASGNKVTKISLVNGSQGVKDLAFSEDGKYLYTVSVISRYEYPTTQLQDGWVNTNGINVIDVAGGKLVTAVLLDDADYGAANPYGIVVKNGKLAVTLAGHDQLMVVDEAKMRTALEKVTATNDSKRIAAVADDLTFLSGMKTRIDLKGKGPRAIALYNNKVVIGNYFSAQMEVCDLSAETVTTSAVSLGNSSSAGEARVGEIIWNDASLCYGGWESCASCHPEGRCDGLNWDEAGDGLGTPKNTKSMMMSHRTPPCLATGVGGDTENNVEGSLKGGVYINGSFTDEQVHAVDTYLKSLAPVPSPYLNRDGTMTADAQKGKTLFAKNCAACHTGPYYTDMQYSVSPTLELDDGPETRAFNTPTLVEIWRSGPYFFNGVYADMEDVVKFYNDKFGLKMTADEQKQVAAFVLSIGTENEFYGVVQPIFKKDGERAIVKPISEGTLSEITVRKQIATGEDAYLTFTLYDASGKKVDGMTATATVSGATAVGDTARLSFDLKLPALTKGMYYEITLKTKSGGDLATPYVYKLAE